MPDITWNITNDEKHSVSMCSDLHLLLTLQTSVTKISIRFKI